MKELVLRLSLERGETITIIYLRDNVITKRNIKVLSISKDYIRAYCFLRKQNRTFKKDCILSAGFYRKDTA